MMSSDQVFCFKMEFSSKHYAEVVRLFYQTKSPIYVIRMMKKQYPDYKELNKWKIYRMVQRFEQTGSVLDFRHKNEGRPRSARSSENLTTVRTVVEETPQKSVRNILREVNGYVNTRVSASSVYRMLKFDLKLTPYKISIMQHLKPSDIASRLNFASWAEQRNEGFWNNVWFSDEAHFYLNTEVNKQNIRFWGSQKPNIYIEKPIHSEKVTAWAALSSSGIIGPFFFEDSDGNATSVNSSSYLDLIRRKFIPALRRKGVNINQIWYQQDGATPHTARNVLDYLDKTFNGHFISFRTHQEWPPHSPDLNPLDFFLWGYLKDKVYTPAPSTKQELKASIRREIRLISTFTLESVIRNFSERIQLVKRQNGRHLEHIL